MNLINTLENEYELYGIRWKEKPHIIMTDLGEKRIRYWKDYERLKWHVKWRDESSKGSGAVPDRMIRTNSGETAIQYGEQWISIHDHAEALFGCDEVERWGQFIGNLLKCAVKYDGKENLDLQTELPVFDINQCLRLSQKYMEANFSCITTSIYEAKERLKLSEAIRSKVKDSELPVLEREMSFKNGKKIFHFLFYQGGDAWPVRGYLPFRMFLLEWLEHSSPLSVKQLLTEVNKHFTLDHEQGLLLLAEIVTPWEIYDCLKQLDNSSLERMVEGLKKYEECWESNRTLVKTVTEWFDEKRRKVAL
ncbi:hypothetical protein AWM68_09990 [Fictibacillus phosphorivorans]|uniref:Uncharacterized protein n=1 Tax=Fictibacillus phosphorivorans TaxID=1221500 RepID=A0A165N3N1_9BACL|nr:hypothetical protein [Fictibacillus phosphorivorans]KZE64471.1 hypothetical protein AWM68_09990 [Fictibacillus phosphorivorans]